MLATRNGCSSREQRLLASIADYNEEDCRATLALRDWLVEHHPAGKAWAAQSQRRSEDDAEDGEREALRQRLIEGEEPGSSRGSPASSWSITDAKRGPRGGGSSSVAIT